MGQPWGALIVSKTCNSFVYYVPDLQIKDYHFQGCQLTACTSIQVIIRERKDHYRPTELNRRENIVKHTRLWLWLNDASLVHVVSTSIGHRLSPFSATPILLCMLQYLENSGVFPSRILEKLLWKDLCLTYDIW